MFTVGPVYYGPPKYVVERREKIMAKMINGNIKRNIRNKRHPYKGYLVCTRFVLIRATVGLIFNTV